MSTQFINEDFNSEINMFDFDDQTLESLSPDDMLDLDLDLAMEPQSKPHKWRSVEEYREWKRLSQQLGNYDYE